MWLRTIYSERSADLFLMSAVCPRMTTKSRGPTEQVRATLLGPTESDAGVPRVATFRRRRAQALAELVEFISQGEPGDVLDVLVAQLTGNAQAKRSAEGDGKLTAVHTDGQQSLWVQGIGHVDAVPPVGLERAVDNVSGLGESAHEA